MCKLSTDDQFTIKRSLKPIFRKNMGHLVECRKNMSRTQFNNLLRFDTDRNHEEITDERLF